MVGCVCADIHKYFAWNIALKTKRTNYTAHQLYFLSRGISLIEISNMNEKNRGCFVSEYELREAKGSEFCTSFRLLKGEMRYRIMTLDEKPESYRSLKFSQFLIYWL